MSTNRRGVKLDTQGSILDRISQADFHKVFHPSDFADIAARPAVAMAITRLNQDGKISRIAHGLYHIPRIGKLTGKPVPPSALDVVNAIARRDGIGFVVDGMTAANDLQWETAVPAKTIVYVPSRITDIKIGNSTIQFRQTNPARLAWAGRPAMTVVQALHYVEDMLSRTGERDLLQERLTRLFADPERGQVIADDLREGFSILPVWMQELLRPYLFHAPEEGIDEELNYSGPHR